MTVRWNSLSKLYGAVRIHLPGHRSIRTSSVFYIGNNSGQRVVIDNLSIRVWLVAMDDDSITRNWIWESVMLSDSVCLVIGCGCTCRCHQVDSGHGRLFNVLFNYCRNSSFLLFSALFANLSFPLQWSARELKQNRQIKFPSVVHKCESSLVLT